VNEIALAMPSKKKLKLLVTGGGAHNNFLIRLLRQELSGQVELVILDKPLLILKKHLYLLFWEYSD